MIMIMIMMMMRWNIPCSESELSDDRKVGNRLTNNHSQKPKAKKTPLQISTYDSYELCNVALCLSLALRRRIR